MPEELYATPEEQYGWVVEQLKQPDIWVVIRRIVGPDLRPIDVLTRRDDPILSSDMFIGNTDTYFVDLHIGHKRLAPVPVLYKLPDGRTEIDPIGSLTVLYAPATAMRTHRVLLQGSMGIARRGYFEDRGVDTATYDLLNKWCRSLKREFTSLRSRDHTVTMTLEDGSVKHLPGVVVTRGAVALWKSGWRLKQVLEGPLEYSVATRPPRAK